MGLPQVNIVFQTLGSSAIQRGERGIVALLLKDTVGLGIYNILSAADIPTTISAANQQYIKFALQGGQNAPLRIIVRVGNEANWTAGQTWLETQKFDYLAIPEVVAGDLSGLYTWIAAQRTNGKMVKAVLPNAAADKEYVVNFTTGTIIVGGTTYTTAQFAPRIAGLLAGTPLQIASTFQPLPDVTSVQSYTKTALDTAIDNGEFVIFHDGEKVKVARGVNSFKTTSANKGNQFKKIKIVDILDQIYTDITKTISDNYIGKYPNNYDNKVLLLTSIQSYFQQLEQANILDKEMNIIEIDIVAQRTYLQSKGIDVTKMTDNDIKIANTDDKLFFRSNVKALDAMEDTSINIYL